jgi:hypothetical protein
MREALVKGNDAGEKKSEPCNKTSVRIKSTGAGKILQLGWIIPLSSSKNQMKSFRGRSLYHKESLRCDLSDDLSGIQQSKIIAD